MVDHSQAPFVLDGEVLQFQHGRAGFRHGLADHQVDGTADHHRRQRRLVGLACCRVSHHLAQPHDRDLVRDGQDFFQFVGNEQDRPAGLGQGPDDLEEAFRFLRGEHGGGLVQDQHLCVSHQRLEDFHLLLSPYRQVLDQGVRGHVETELVGYPQDVAAGFAPVEKTQTLDGLETEDDVLCHRENWHQHEVLVDHADAPPDRFSRVSKAHRVTVDTYLARVGVEQAEQDVHEGALAGAVLPQETVDLPLLQGEIHVVVGDERPKCLGDAHQLEPH